MLKTKTLSKAITMAAMLCTSTAFAQLNMPIIQTKYTADPAPYVHGDTVYLFTTHDEDGAGGFMMKDWLLYTSTDMVNWEDHGAVGIGVLVADSPFGPYKDPLGNPLVWQKEHWYDIDPTVWIDDDGQAYLYWGNPNLYMVKLNEDMISYSGEIVEHPKIKDYQEGPWFWSRKNAKGEKCYYMAFASTCCPEGIGLNYDVFRMETSRHAEQRSVSAAEMTYNADGTIQELPYFQDCKLEQVGSFNPFRQVQAETMAWGYGLKTTRENPSGPWNPTLFVTDIDDGEYIMLKGVDFGKGAKKFTASCSAHLYGGEMELHLDDVDGPMIGKISVPNTKFKYQEFTTNLTNASGKHDLYLVFKGGKMQKRNLFNFDWWKME